MAQSKLNRYLHGSACECHGMQPELCRNATKVNRKIVLVYALAVLLVLSGVFSTGVRAENALGMGTILLGVQVDPPSGSAGFRLTVDYAWYRKFVGSPAVISCAYMRPDGIWVPIGEIDRSSDIFEQLSTEDMIISNQSSLNFNVASSDGTIEPGAYKVRCTSGQMFAVETAFSVVPDETAETIAESEPAVTEAPLRVYHLQVKMVYDSSDDVMTAQWDGNLTVKPDGTIRTKLPGFISVDSSTRDRGKITATYHYNIFFMIDVAGAAETTPAGITMRLMQTLDFFKVLPPEMTFFVEMPPQSQSDIDEAKDYLKKIMEEALPKYLDQILRGLDFEKVTLPNSQDISVGIWKGTAVLSPEKKWVSPSK